MGGVREGRGDRRRGIGWRLLSSVPRLTLEEGGGRSASAWGWGGLGMAIPPRGSHSSDLPLTLASSPSPPGVEEPLLGVAEVRAVLASTELSRQAPSLNRGKMNDAKLNSGVTMTQETKSTAQKGDEEGEAAGACREAVSCKRRLAHDSLTRTAALCQRGQLQIQDNGRFSSSWAFRRVQRSACK